MDRMIFILCLFSVSHAVAAPRMGCDAGMGGRSKLFPPKLEKGEGSVEVKKLVDERWQLKLTVVPDRLSAGSTVQVETSCKGKFKIRVPLSVREK